MASIIQPPVQLRATKKELIAVVTATLSALNEKVNTVDFLGITQDIITALDKKADQSDFISVTSATIDALDKKVDTVDFLGVVQDTINSIKERALAGANTDITSLTGLTTLSLTGSSTAAALVAAGSYTAGIDLSSATLSSFGIKLPNNASISWLSSTATGNFKALYVDTSNRLIIGNGISTRVNVTANQNFDIRGPVSLGSGISLTSQNDAANATTNLEILSSYLYLNSPVTRVSGNLRKSAAIIAAAGTTQATATVLSNDINSVNSGTGGVILQGLVGQKQEIFNRSGAAINIYPPTGTSIESAGTNAAVSLANGGHATFIALTATQIYQTV